MGRRAVAGWLLAIGVGVVLLWWSAQRRGGSVARESGRIERSAAPPSTPSPESAKRPRGEASPIDGGVFSILVESSGRSIANAIVSTARLNQDSLLTEPSWLPGQSDTTGADGRVVIPAIDGVWVLSAKADGFAESVVDVVKPVGERFTTVRISLSRPVDLDGLAIDASDRPVVPAAIRAIPLGERNARRISSPLGVHEVTVDTHGRFHFSDLDSGWWRLEGEAEGLGRADGIIVAIPVDRPVTLRFRTSGFLEGTVVAADGGVAANAQVIISGANGATRLEAGTSGSFATELQPGSYRVRANLGPLVGAARAVALISAKVTTSTRVVLNGRGGTLRGTVSGEGSTKVAGASIVISPHRQDGASAQTTTGDVGDWEVTSLPQATWDVSAAAPGFASHVQQGVFLGNEQIVVVDFQLEALAVVAGSVTDSAGRPVEAELTLSTHGAHRSVQSAKADGRGHYEFRNVEPGRVVVTASRTRLEQGPTQSVIVGAGRTTTVDFTLADSVEIEVEIDRNKCRKHEDFTLEYGELIAFAQAKQRALKAGENRLTVRLSPGQWQFVARAEHCVSEPEQVELTFGAPLRSLKLVPNPMDPPLRVKVLEADGHPSAGAKVTVTAADERVWSGEADADGETEWWLDQPATRAFAANQGRSAQRAVVPGAKELTLTLSAAARIKLHLVGTVGTTKVELEQVNTQVLDVFSTSASELECDEVPEGDLRLTGSSADGKLIGQTRVQTRSGQTATGTLLLGPAGTVRGVATLAPGTVPGAWVTLRGPALSRDTTVAADGSFGFDTIVPGAYELQVRCSTCGAPFVRAVNVAPATTMSLSLP